MHQSKLSNINKQTLNVCGAPHNQFMQVTLEKPQVAHKIQLEKVIFSPVAGPLHTTRQRLKRSFTQAQAVFPHQPLADSDVHFREKKFLFRQKQWKIMMTYLFLFGFPNKGEERSIFAPRSQRPWLWIHEKKLHWKYGQFLYGSTLVHFYSWIWSSMFLFIWDSLHWRYGQ